MNLFKELWDNFTNINNIKMEPPVAPTEVIMYNDMYPYTVNRTITVTHHSKPKRRDPSRRYNKILIT
jgi:hypothetical protein